MADAPAERDPNRVPVIQGVDSISFTDTTSVAVNPTTHAMLVEASFSPSGTQDVNLTKVGGTSFALGQQLAASSLPVVLTAAQISTLTPLSTVAATQSGTWNINNISGTVSLPTGASTLAEQQTQTTALGNLLTTSDFQTRINTLGQKTMTNSTPVVLSSDQTSIPVTLTSTTVTGTVAVTQSTSPWIVAGGGTAGTAASGVVTVQGIASMTPIQVGDNSSSLSVDWNGTQPVTGSGTATGALRVELPTNGTGVIATVSAVTSITNALPAGTNAIGKLAANSGVDIGDVDVTSIAAGTNNIGQVSVAPQTANGLSVFNATSSDGATALTSTAQAIKASAGQLYGWYIYNPNSSAQFVQLYNTAAASVTVGSTNPLFMLTIPATSAANVEFTNGITFSNAGWSAAATSTAGGSGAPSTALDAVFFYK